MKNLLLFFSLFISNPITSVPPPTSIPPPFQGGGQGVVNSPSSERGGIQESPSFSRRGQGVVSPQPTCYTFTIDNISSHALGTVTVSAIGNSTNFYVTDTGFYQQEICYSANCVTVAGNPISYPGPGVVDLGNSTFVRVTWQSSSVIEITDAEETGSPQP